MKIVAGQTALVTGASRGLGVHIAEALAGRGMDLALSARSGAELDAAAGRLRRETGRRVFTFVADLANPSDVAALAAKAVEQLGGVDVLVNNAGIEATRRFDLRAPEEIARMMAVNLTAPMLLTRALLPQMIARGGGHVVNIASLAGLMSAPYEEPYNATKFGLVGFTRALRLSARDRGWPVGASAVCPGFMDGAGIYEDMKRRYGVRAPASLGALPARDIGPAVLQAIDRDLPDVILGKGRLRLAAAISVLFPSHFERLSARAGSGALFRTISEASAEEAG